MGGPHKLYQITHLDKDEVGLYFCYYWAVSPEAAEVMAAMDGREVTGSELTFDPAVATAEAIAWAEKYYVDSAFSL